MLATLKVHSAFSGHFNSSEYGVDINTYADLIPYLASMHPKFKNYMLQIETQEADESFCLLDDDLNVIDNEAIFIKRVRDGEVIHLVPAIVGGGGKRGTMFAIFAMTAVIIATGGAGAAAAGGGLGGAGAAATPLSTGFGPPVGQAISSSAASGSFFSGMSGTFMRLAGNLALSLLSSLFASKPKQQDRDTTTRESNMFGSLVNSTTSGTPIPLVYGHMRVGGQMLSGYLDSEVHGKSDIVNVGEKFD